MGKYLDMDKAFDIVETVNNAKDGGLENNYKIVSWNDGTNSFSINFNNNKKASYIYVQGTSEFTTKFDIADVGIDVCDNGKSDLILKLKGFVMKVPIKV